MGGGLKLCLGFLEEGPHRRYYGTGDRTVACTPSPALYTPLGFEEDTQAAAPCRLGFLEERPHRSQGAGDTAGAAPGTRWGSGTNPRGS